MTLLYAQTVGQGRELAQVRQAARAAAKALGFDETAQTRLSTAVSEAVRAALAGAKAEVSVEVEDGELRVCVRGDAGALRGEGVEQDALAVARRLVPRSDLRTLENGRAEVVLAHPLPDPRLAPQGSEQVRRALSQEPMDPLREADQAYRELLRAHAELQARQQELDRVNRELEETNRGVVALYAELEEKAEALRRASEIKSRFISNVSHEFRTPINSILSLSRILIDRVDGPLNDEQHKQVKFVRKSAEALSELVNDLLDLAKIESGKVDVRPGKFEVDELFAALRGIMRPLLTNDQVALNFESSSGLSPLFTDEGKLSQILRNLISNALKFTEKGEVRVRAEPEPGGTIHFSVQDSGIGIAPEFLDRIFEEFVQVEGPLQKRVKGTGLGLPLSRRLAELLGGTLTVESAMGEGSTFHLRIPRAHGETASEPSAQAEPEPASKDEGAPGAQLPADGASQPVLIVEDDPQTLFIYEKYLRDSGFQVVPATTVAEARARLSQVRPAAVVLDVLLDGDTSWGFLGELRSDPSTRDIPVLVVTVIGHQLKARALGADDFCLKPIERNWLLSRLTRLSSRQTSPRVLVVDDDDVSRYVVRRALEGTPYELLEASGGQEGLVRAERDRPDVILLDLMMPDLSGFDVLDRLKSQPGTKDIPVIVHSARALTDAERARLSRVATGLVVKDPDARDEALGRIRSALLSVGIHPSTRS